MAMLMRRENFMQDYELTEIPNDQYRKFFDKFKEIETLKTSDWKANHLIGYFCKKYYDLYGVKYKFKLNSAAPSKCFEVFQMKKLAYMLTANPILLKEYIDWVFENKIIKAKRRLTSISFLTAEGIVKEYKFNILLNSKRGNNTVDRTTPLPDKYKTIFKNVGIDLRTYGDLAFLYHATDTNEDVKKAFDDATIEGLNIELLNKVV